MSSRRKYEHTPSANHLHLVKTHNIVQLHEDHHRAMQLADSGPVYTITSISPTSIDNDEVVTVSFNSTAPDNSDWIGAYSPPNVDITNTAPVKFGFCDMGEGDYLSTGLGQLTFNMTNLRAGIKFYYFINGTSQPVSVATSTTLVNFNNINEPLRNRVLPTGDPDVYQVLWSSTASTAPVLRWGLQSNTYTHTANASYSSVTQSQMCGAPANSTGWREVGVIYRANLTGMLQLAAGTQLFYVFGDSSSASSMSQEVVFRMPPAAGQQPGDRPTQVALLADLGVGSTDTSYDTNVWNEACPPGVNTSMSIGDLVLRGEVDAVFLSGDMAYSDGYMSSWDFFLDMVSPVLGRALFLSTVGNHESDWPGTASLDIGDASGGECGVLSSSMLPMPSPATMNQPWWSYDIGIIHFLGMSTEHNYTIGSPQYLWLEQDLAAVNRTKTPWIIFSGHRSMYVDSAHCCASYYDDDCVQCAEGSDVGGMEALQANIEPMLHKYRVNLAFAGHFHQAQRQAAVYQNMLVQASSSIINSDGQTVAYHNDPNATVWMVIGSAGNGPDYANINYTWSEKYWNDLWGYAMVAAVNSTYLTWELINSANDQVVDRMAISQDFESWEPSSPSSSSSDGLSATDTALISVFSIVGGLALIGALVKFVLFPAMASSSSANVEGKALSKNVQLPEYGSNETVAKESKV